MLEGGSRSELYQCADCAASRVFPTVRFRVQGADGHLAFRYIVIDSKCIATSHLEMNRAGPAADAHVIFGWMRDDGSTFVNSFPSAGNLSETLISAGYVVCVLPRIQWFTVLLASAPLSRWKSLRPHYARCQILEAQHGIYIT